MAFQKGNQLAKLKGKNQKTLAWDQLGNFFTDAGAERAKQIMLTSKDKEFMQYYTNLVELFKPKLARTETDITSDGKAIKQNVIKLTDGTEITI